MLITVDEERNIKYYGDTIIDKTWNFFYYKSIISPKNRINVLKNEIFKNLPNVKTERGELYIYIRSGDIFASHHPHPRYIQPPSCYYEKILDNLIFRKIYLISQNKLNPVVDNLLNKYKSIMYNNNTIQVDISYLANAYNIIGGGTSTFFSQILSLNDNLELLYKYNMHYRSEIESKKFNVRLINKLTIFEIFAPKEYLIKMYPWKNDDEQREFMVNFIC